MEPDLQLRRSTRDVDAPARARFIQAASWSFFAAFFMSIAVSWAGGWRAGLIAFFGVLVGGVVVAIGVSELAGALTRQLTDPSVGKRPKRLSKAQALAARGRYAESAVELEAAVRAAPDDLEPYLLLARLHRDELDDREGAARWLRAARDRARISEGAERALQVELIETLRRIDPLRAAPELARMAERFDGTPDGEWARRELAEVKGSIRRE